MASLLLKASTKVTQQKDLKTAQYVKERHGNPVEPVAGAGADEAMIVNDSR